MKTTTIFVAAALLAEILSADASPRFFIEHFDEVTAVDLVVADLDQDSRRCGLDDINAPLLIVSIQTLRTPNGVCFSSVQMDLNLTLPASAPHSKNAITAEEQRLWEASNIGYSAAAAHASQARELIEVMTKKFITDWNLARKTRN